MQVALQQLNSGCAREGRRGWRGPLHTRGDMSGRVELPPLPCCSSHQQVFIPKCLCAVTQNTWGIKQVSPTLWNSARCLAERPEEKSIWLVTQENVKGRCKEEECDGIVCPCSSILCSCKGIHWTFQWLFSSAKYDSEGKKKSNTKEKTGKK